MRITAAFLILGLALCVHCAEVPRKEDDGGLLECMFEENTTTCLRTRMAREMDNIEVQVTGKKTETPISTLVEQTGSLVADVVDDLQNPGKAEEAEEPAEGEQVEARKKKFGKRKKKHLQKLIGIVMLFKAKLSLLLQLISTHLQVKFFLIAIVSLILNATKFWLDLKKSPSKVIYYEHAQHQHHYDHDEHDHGGYWGRSSNDSPQDMAYAAYAPQK